MGSMSEIVPAGSSEGVKGQNINFIPIPPRIWDFATARAMYVVQVNAQRYFGPSIHVTPGYEPPQGSEIFLGKIPRYFHEPELLPFLEHVGPIFQLRLMMNFSGTNKGYCFVQYFHPEQAKLAVNAFHGAEISPGCFVVASMSVDNRKLLLGGVPTVMTPEEILEEVKQVSEGVAYVHTTWLPPVEQSKGIVYVTYENHRAAAMARKRMLTRTVEIGGVKIHGDWAEPDHNSRDDIMSIPQILCVRGVTTNITTKVVRDIFNLESCKGVKRVRRFRSYIYIYFKSRGQAEQAKMALNGAEIQGIRISVEWSNPNKMPQFRTVKKPMGKNPAAISAPIATASSAAGPAMFATSTTTIIQSKNVMNLGCNI